MAGQRAALRSPPAPQPPVRALASRGRSGRGKTAALAGGPVWWQDYLAASRQPYLANELARLSAPSPHERAAADIDEIHEYLSSPLARLHGLGARRLQSISDEYLGELQRTWHARYGQNLIGFVAERLRHGATPGLRRAAELLRAGFARNAPLQREFVGAYADPKLVGEYAWQLRQAFEPTRNDFRDRDGRTVIRRSANRDEKLALGVLQNQPATLLSAINAAFARSYGEDIVPWLVREVPRSEAFVLAIAILRHGSERPEAVEHRGYVDIAAQLIPPEVSNKADPLALLKGLKHAERLKLQDAFNQVFKGIGPGPGQATPDTLHAYLAIKFSALRDVAPWHEVQALLYHQPTDAENLYFQLARWEHTHDEAAIKLLADLVKRGASWQKLNADWDSFVRGGLQGSTAAFSNESMREHIKSVLTGSDEQRALAQLDALEYEGESAPEADAQAPLTADSLPAKTPSVAGSRTAGCARPRPACAPAKASCSPTTRRR